MKNGKLRVLNDGRVAFFCPGCKEYHVISIEGNEGEHPIWKFNGDYDHPTFTPSILLKSGHYCDGDDINCWCRWAEKHPGEVVPFKCTICHSFVTDGKIQYLNDCTHELAGQTVEMVDPDDLAK